jgi:D-3-phosphoglycerate dehydrogenase / 2-oxoglutarate reductase
MERMKILVSDHLEKALFDILTEEKFQVDNMAGIAAADLKNSIAPYHGLVVRSATKVTAELMQAAPLLRVVGRAGTGVDNIDVEAATRRGILVMNTPGGNTISAAEHTVSMLLSLARNIPQANKSLSAGVWDRKSFVGTEVHSKTLGVIGLGKIGREVAARCQGLGMTVIGFDPLLNADVAARSGIELLSLDEIYRRADFITLHTPLTPETHHLINDASLGKCKKSVRIINCARGGIVDEAAVLRALDAGRLAGVALDVFEIEPPGNNPLLNHPRAIATPHLGASTEEAQEKVAVQLAHQLADALSARGYGGLVNGSSLQLSLTPEIKPYLDLAERLGRIAAQLTVGKVTKIEVIAHGEMLGASMDPLKAGVLKGVLSHLSSDPVNIINAAMLAAEVGLDVSDRREGTGDNYPNVLVIRYYTEGGYRELGGTVFGATAMRLVRFDGYRLEVAPEGTLLVYNNTDKPGVLARVGKVLARHGVNIAGVSLGRSSIGGNAMTVMNLDGDVPLSGVEELLAEEGLSGVRVIHLD